MRALFAIFIALLLAGSATAKNHVSFPTEDGGVIYADIYSQGARAIN